MSNSKAEGVAMPRRRSPDVAAEHLRRMTDLAEYYVGEIEQIAANSYEDEDQVNAKEARAEYEAAVAWLREYDQEHAAQAAPPSAPAEDASAPQGVQFGGQGRPAPRVIRSPRHALAEGGGHDQQDPQGSGPLATSQSRSTDPSGSLASGTLPSIPSGAVDASAEERAVAIEEAHDRYGVGIAAVALDHLRAYGDQRAAEGRRAGLEEGARIAKRSQEDCFCKEQDFPCAACMEAARIEGVIRGTADRSVDAAEPPPRRKSEKGR